MITGMDRLAAALKGEVLDRIPVFCNLLDQGAIELGMPLDEFYRNGELVAEAQLKMRERYGYDNVWSLFYVGKEAELLGSKKTRFYKDGPPNVEDFVIKKIEDIDTLVVPENIVTDPNFEEQLKCLRILKREAGGKHPICAYITATMALPALLMGMERWLELLLMGPASARDVLLEKCHLFFRRETQAFRENGADVIIYSNPFGSTDFLSMKYLLQHSLPWIERDIHAIGTAGVVYYAGMARFNRVIETIIERTGIGAYYLSPLDDLAEGKRIIAGRALTCGVINDIKLIDWSPDEVAEEVKRMLRAGMEGGRFLFGTGVMPYGIPEENIRTMLEVACRYGSEGSWSKLRQARNE